MAKARETMVANLTPVLELQFFGSPQLRLGGQVINDKISGRSLALLSYLAVTGRPHTRDRLADLLWDDLTSQQARNNLRYLLPDLRRTIGDYLCIKAETIAFNRQAPHWLDVDALRTIQNATPPVSTQAWQQALDLYQGEFLAGFRVRNAPNFEAWVTAQQEELHQVAMQGYQQLAQRYLAEDNTCAGINTVQRLLRSDPWHEAGQRLFMQLLAANGQRAAAVEQYQQFRYLLQNEVGVEPAAATQALYEQIRRGSADAGSGEQEKRAWVNQPSLAAPRHNLPSNLTPFFGRSTEIEQIRALLVDAPTRLVTLIGEGGSGKTRLALAVAQSIVEVREPPANDFRHRLFEAEATYTSNQTLKVKNQKFTDGVWFVALSALTTTGNRVDQLAVALAQAIGLSLGGQSVFTQLLAYLHNKRLLLLFDNAEHLLPEVADFLVQILRATPSITVLVTSRHRLDLQAEFVWRMTGLDVPFAADLTPSALMGYSSIALFVERARRHDRGFQVRAENHAAIVSICRLVEGLPLAIELAAALTKQYTCAALHTALQRDYTILAATSSDLPTRHRSIKTMLDYSWRLLTAPAAALLAACTAFPRSFNLAAIMAITGADGEDITKLVDQSLIYESQDVDGHRRYALHPLVRQYAADQLQLQPEAAHSVYTAHCAYYVALLVRQSKTLAREPATFSTLQIELDNLRAAWSWAIAQAHFEWLHQCSKPLSQFYKIAGFYEEAEAAFRQAVNRLTSMAAPTAPFKTEQMRLLATLQVEQAYYCARLAQVEQAEALADAALQIGVTLNDEQIKAQSYLGWAISCTQRNDYAGARSAASAAAAAAQAAAQPELEAWAKQNLGVTYLADGEPAQGISQLQQALSIAEPLGDRQLEALIRGSLGSGYYITGNFAYAHRYLQQAWQTSQAMQLPRVGLVALSWLSSLYIQIGRYDLATQHAQQAQTVARELGRQTIEIEANTLFALAAYYQGKLTTAHLHSEFAIQLAEEHNLGRYTALARLIQGHLLCAQAQWQAAAVAYEQAKQAYVNRTQPLWNLRAEAGLAQCWLRTGNLAQALSHVEALLPMLTAQGQGGGMNVYETVLIGYEILTAATDARADGLLDDGYHLLQAQAAHFDDEAMRQMFLEQVAANRKLLALWSAQQQANLGQNHTLSV